MVNQDTSIRFRGDKTIWVIALLLSLISIVAVFSSSGILIHVTNKSATEVLFRQISFVVMGLVAMYLVSRIPLRWFRSLSFLALIASTILVLLVLFISEDHNNAKRWLSIFGFQFQPSEIVKITVVLYIARILELNKANTFKEFAILVLAPVSVPLLLVLNGSISTGIFISVIIFLLLILAQVKASHIIKTALMVFVAVFIIFALNKTLGFFPRIDTASSRIERFFNHDKIDVNAMTPAQIQLKADENYQSNMAYVAISSVGIVGKGPGKSTQRYFLPQPYSDFIFAIIVEEWGLIGVIVVITLFLIMQFRAVTIAKGCTRTYSALVVMGISLMITLQAFLHIFVNIGLFPVTGHTLPLISHGGSSFIIMSIALGIIQSVSRSTEKELAENETEL